MISKKSICQAYTSDILIARYGSPPLALITFHREEFNTPSVYFFLEGDRLIKFIGVDRIAGQVDYGIIGQRLGEGDISDRLPGIYRGKCVIMHAGSQFRRIEDMGGCPADTVCFQGREAQPEKMEAGLSPFFIKYSLRPRNRYRCRIDTDAVSYPPTAYPCLRLPWAVGAVCRRNNSST